jgi:hypothetical protein
MSWIITGQSVNAPLLDIYSGAAAAYSLRQLQSGSYPVVRVRRSSDNTESDFTATEVSDGTLAAWVGAGNDGFVRTWYDQSGNGNNAVQSTSDNQPQIVDTGQIVEAFSQPCIKTDGTNDSMSAVFSSAELSSVSLVSVVTRLSGNNFINMSANSVADGLFYVRSDGFDERLPFDRYTSSSYPGDGLLSMYQGSGTYATYYNSIQQTSFSTTAVYKKLYLGVQANSPNYGSALINEIVLYPSNQSANRAAIEANINAHYSIYP